MIYVQVLFKAVNGNATIGRVFPASDRLLWQSLRASVRPSVVLAQLNLNRRRRRRPSRRRRRPSLWFAALYRGRVILASPRSLARPLGHRSDGQLGNGRSQHRLMVDRGVTRLRPRHGSLRFATFSRETA